MAAYLSSTLVCGPPLHPPVSVGPISSTNQKLDLHRPHRHNQATEEERRLNLKLQAAKTSDVSRRDTMCLAAQTLAAAAFWSAEPEPAGARMDRSEIRRKLMEKLKQVREKAGLANPKDESPQSAPPQPPAEEAPRNPPTLADGVFP